MNKPCASKGRMKCQHRVEETFIFHTSMMMMVGEKAEGGSSVEKSTSLVLETDQSKTFWSFDLESRASFNNDI